MGPPTVRLYLVSDLAGALEPCGCTKDQLGGLDHFGAWIEADRARAPARVVASAGPLFFMDTKLDPEKADQDRAKAHAIAHILERLDFAAFAPGANDWAAGAGTLSALAREAKATALVEPPLGRAGDGPDGGGDDPPLVVRDVGTSGVRVGFVGYGQPGGPGALARESAEAATRRGVDRAKSLGANVLVALVAAGRGEAKRVADAVPELTMVVVGSAKSDGDANDSAPEGERVGDVLIAQSSNHLQSVAVVDLFVREPISPGRVLRFADGTGLELARRRQDLRARIDDLHVKIAAWERDGNVRADDLADRRRDLSRLESEFAALEAKAPPATGSFFRYGVAEIRESLGRDAAIDRLMLDYYKSVDEHNRASFQDRLPIPAAAGAATYVGVERCSACHAAPRRVWDGTRHAHAYATLADQFKEFNLDCVSCHVTGYDKPGGSTVTHVDALRNVQCEVCHGPGSNHVKSPSDPRAIVASPSPALCLGCHHPPHVEQFDAAAKMHEILGPGHGRPAE